VDREPAAGVGVAVAAVVVGWAATLIGDAAGWRHTTGHDHVIETGGSLLADLASFGLGWQVMVAAMMLPSSVGAVRWLHTWPGVSQAPRRRTLEFLAGYGVAWAVVGLAALAGDSLIHDVSHRVGFLESRPWLIGAGALLVGGAFQLSRWSQRCRRTEPVHVRAEMGGVVGTRAALRLGSDHAMVRLRDCWPVMLIAFAFGMTSVAWMAGLTVLMTVERSRRWGPSVALLSGLAFVAAAAAMVAHPGWLPIGRPI
jgi:predicted metal-binding membrane protein